MIMAAVRLPAQGLRPGGAEGSRRRCRRRDMTLRLRYDSRRSPWEERMNRPLLLSIAAGMIALVAVPTAQADSALDRAYRVIAQKRFVDLTHSFGPQTPVWSGFGQAKMTPAADPQTRAPYTIAKDGFRTTFYAMVGQYGTHVDPPAHFAENGIT